MSQLRLALLVALLVGVLGQSSAIKCYFCEYMEGFSDPKNCQSDPDSSLLFEITDVMLVPIPRVESSSNPAATFFQKYNSSVSIVQSTGRSNVQAEDWPYKYCATGTFTENGKNIVVRNAIGAKETAPTECETTNDATLCLCDTDGCNNSNHLNSQIGFTVLISIGTYILNIV